MQIHSRKMTVSPDVNFDELARSCDEFNGAQCKAICVEAGMIALRRGAVEITHEDFMEGIQEVQAKKKTSLQVGYFLFVHNNSILIIFNPRTCFFVL
jgi:26S proteasome regulatory subunit T5